MLEKGKWALLGKLRVINLIEGYLQLLIWLYVRMKMMKTLELTIDYQNLISDLETVFYRKYITKKRLIYDTSKYNNENIMHLFLDLEAYYDR